MSQLSGIWVVNEFWSYSFHTEQMKNRMETSKTNYCACIDIISVARTFFCNCSDMTKTECLQVSLWTFAKHIPRSEITPSACTKHSSHTQACTSSLYKCFDKTGKAEMIHRLIPKCQ